MAYSVKFDSTEILNTSTYKTSSVKHHSAPTRNINLLELARDDGAIIVNEKYGTKTITIQGVLQGSSASDLQTKLDTFKELFSRSEKNLDITPDGGSIRRYVATCTRHDLPENHYNILILPFTADFVVADGVGRDTIATAIVNAQAISATTYTSSMVLAGSAKPKPIIDILIGSNNTNSRGIAFENTDNGQKIIITKTTAFANAIHLIINCQNKTVQYNAEDIRFYGPFPEFLIGTNNFKFYSGSIIQQAYADNPTGTGTDYWAIYGNRQLAQSFSVPFTDNTFRGIGIYRGYVGLSGGTGTWYNLNIQIVNDSGNAPDLSSVVVTFPAHDIRGAYTQFNPINHSSNFTLNSGTKYWMVFDMDAGGDIATQYGIIRYKSSGNTYKLGNQMYSTDGGSTWASGDGTLPDTGDMVTLFKLYYGGVVDASPAFTLDVDMYKSYL